MPVSKALSDSSSVISPCSILFTRVSSALRDCSKSAPFFFTAIVCSRFWGPGIALQVRCCSACKGRDYKPPPAKGGRSFTEGGCKGEKSARSEEHTSELQSREKLVCRLLL